MKKKLVYIVSDIDKSLHFEWINPHLHANYQLTYILIGARNTFLERWLRASGVMVLHLNFKKKSDLVLVWLKIFIFLIRNKPGIVHTHLWIANLTGLSAAWLSRIRKRIYTRHHGTLHHKEFPSGLKWDKMCNFFATDIIAISKNVKDILIKLDGAQQSKVTLIHHGFNFSYFTDVDENRIQDLRSKLKIPSDSKPVIGVISRFVEWKGVQYIVPAFGKLLEAYPDAFLVLANASGSYEGEINQLLKTLPSSSYTRVKFENDLAALYKLLDMLVHVPVDEDSEAFGQTYVEALIAGVPGIFTLSGVASEFIRHEENALVVDFKNSDQIFVSIERLIADVKLKNRIIENGTKSVKAFTLENYLDRLDTLYLS